MSAGNDFEAFITQLQETIAPSQMASRHIGPLSTKATHSQTLKSLLGQQQYGQAFALAPPPPDIYVTKADTDAIIWSSPAPKALGASAPPHGEVEYFQQAWERVHIQPLVTVFPKGGPTVASPGLTITDQAPDYPYSVYFRSPHIVKQTLSLPLQPAGITGPTFPLTLRPRPELHVFGRDPTDLYALLTGVQPWGKESPYEEPYPIDAWDYLLSANVKGPTTAVGSKGPPYTLPAAVVVPFGAPKNEDPGTAWRSVSPLLAGDFWGHQTVDYGVTGVTPVATVSPVQPSDSWVFQEGMPFPTSFPDLAFSPIPASGGVGDNDTGSIMSMWHVTVPECSTSISIQNLLSQLGGSVVNGISNFGMDFSLWWVLPLAFASEFATGFLSTPIATLFENPFLPFFAPYNSVDISLELLHVNVSTFMKHNTAGVPYHADSTTVGLHSGVLVSGSISVKGTAATEHQTSIVDFVCEYNFTLVNPVEFPDPDSRNDDGFLTFTPTIQWLSLTDPKTGNPNDGTVLGGNFKSAVTDFLVTKLPAQVLTASRTAQQVSLDSLPLWLCDPTQPMTTKPPNVLERLRGAEPPKLAQCINAKNQLFEAAESGWLSVAGHLPSDPELIDLRHRVDDPAQWSCRYPTIAELRESCASPGYGDGGRCQFAARMTSVLGLEDEVRLKPFENLDDLSQNGLIIFYASLQALTGYDTTTWRDSSGNLYPGLGFLGLCNPPIEADPSRGYYLRNLATLHIGQSAEGSPPFNPPPVTGPLSLGPCWCNRPGALCVNRQCVQGVCAGDCFEDVDCQISQYCERSDSSKVGVCVQTPCWPGCAPGYQCAVGEDDPYTYACRPFYYPSS